MKILGSLFAGIIIGYIIRVFHETWASLEHNAQKIKNTNSSTYPYWHSLSSAMEEANQIMKWRR